MAVMPRGGGWRTIEQSAVGRNRVADRQAPPAGAGPAARTHRARRERRRKSLRRTGTRTLARGATVEVRLTRSARIGRVLRFKMGAPGTPSVEFKCLPPGGRLRDC